MKKTLKVSHHLSNCNILVYQKYTVT